MQLLEVGSWTVCNEVVKGRGCGWDSNNPYFIEFLGNLNEAVHIKHSILPVSASQPQTAFKALYLHFLKYLVAPLLQSLMLTYIFFFFGNNAMNECLLKIQSLRVKQQNYFHSYYSWWYIKMTS